MTGEFDISREEFLALPVEEIRQIVREKNKPKGGVFIADGNRRLVLCKTRLNPTSDEFYRAYARIFIDSLRESLSIFFSHGLETLFFPLFGPSLLVRKNGFQSITIPAFYREIFQGEDWFRFFKENGIRVKTYGDLSYLEKIDSQGLNMARGIKEAVERAALHDKHTLYFGFMSENTACLEMPEKIIDFYKEHKRAPNAREMVEMYYGENISPVDFIIFSNKLSSQGALPPLISAQKAKLYYLPVPGFEAFSESIYRRIIFDLLYVLPGKSLSEYDNDNSGAVASLDKFYQRHRDTIIGTGEIVGNFWVPNI